MQSSSFLLDWFWNACIIPQRAEVWAWLIRHTLSLLLEKSLGANVLTELLTSTLFRITSFEQDVKPVYVFLKDPDDLSPNWPSKFFYIVRDYDENSLLLEPDSLQSAMLSGPHAFSHSHLRVIPCNMDCFYSLFVGEKTVAARNRLTFLRPQIHWLAELGLWTKSCLTPELMLLPTIPPLASLRILHRTLNS